MDYAGPATKDQLIAVLKNEFNKIPQKVIDAWIDKYWSRLGECVAVNGDWVGSAECRLPRVLA